MLCAVLAAAALPGCAVSTGSIRGRIVGSGPAGADARSEPVVVFARSLDRVEGRASGSATVRVTDEGFEPALLAIAAGQTVRFVNDDGIYHHPFSACERNAFDLGRMCRGEAITVRLDQPGPVPFYCSLHAGERGVVLVTPTPHFAIVDPSGAFELAGLRPGRYELRTLGGCAAGEATPVTVRSGASSVELTWGASSEAR